jgi:hypothetical protein
MGTDMKNRTTIDKFLHGLVVTSITLALVLLAMLFLMIVKGG